MNGGSGNGGDDGGGGGCGSVSVAFILLATGPTSICNIQFGIAIQPDYPLGISFSNITWLCLKIGTWYGGVREKKKTVCAQHVLAHKHTHILC